MSEEAVEAESPTIDSENCVTIDDGNAGLIETLEKGMENSNLVSEVVEEVMGHLMQHSTRRSPFLRLNFW